MLRGNNKLPALDEGVRKKVRLALTAGDDSTAKQELAKVVSDFDLIDFYLRHIAEEEERENREHYEQTIVEFEDEEEDAILALAINGLKLDDDEAEVVTCPVCENGHAIRGPRYVECTNCELQVFHTGSLEALGQILAEALVKHTLNCTVARPRILQTVHLGLVLCCSSCHVKTNVVLGDLGSL